MTDEQLVGRYMTTRDERALETLIKRYMPRIFGYVKNFTGDKDIASDITQDTFVKAWKNLKHFDTNKNFKTWVFTIAKNTALDWLKKKNPVLFSKMENEQFADMIADDTPSILDTLFAAEASRNVRLALAQLPDSYSSIIGKYTRDDMNFREIAEEFGESINTIKSRYRRGLVLLKNLLGDV